MDRLMCPPTQFQIEYSINPWMDPAKPVDEDLALEQWEAVKALLESKGDQIHLIEAASGVPDMTFAGDAGFVWGNRYIPSNFRHPQRREEVPHYIEWFTAHDFEVVPVPEGVWFEGQGDLVFHQHRAVVGYGMRSDYRAVEVIRRSVPEMEVVAKMEIVDDHYFHLAMALSFVDEQTAIVYPAAFTPSSLEDLKRAVRNVIPISQQDADIYFACNNLVIGDSLIVDGCTDEFRTALGRFGYEVVTCPVSEFKKSGGSLRCLVLTFM
jgi:N-dimethylarginine dimethylaminohydrolase